MTVSAQFTAIKQVRSSGRKVFGFVGQIGNRFDFPWLLQVMQAFPEHVFVFVGAIWAWKELDDTNLADQIATLQKQPNYLHIPSVPKAQIPLLVNQFDFGLIPYTTNQVFNKNCHPMKLYEYWWFGKPVVATAIYELSRYQYGICSTDSAVSAIKWIKKMLNGDHLHRLKQKTRQIARDNSWQAKLTAISNVVSS